MSTELDVCNALAVGRAVQAPYDKRLQDSGKQGQEPVVQFQGRPAADPGVTEQYKMQAVEENRMTKCETYLQDVAGHLCLVFRLLGGSRAAGLKTPLISNVNIFDGENEKLPQDHACLGKGQSDRDNIG